MELGNRIRRIRESYQFTQSEVAYRCNMSPQAYGQIERNAGRAKVETLNKVANALGVSLVFLIDVNNEYLIEQKQVATCLKE